MQLIDARVLGCALAASPAGRSCTVTLDSNQLDEDGTSLRHATFDRALLQLVQALGVMDSGTRRFLEP